MSEKEKEHNKNESSEAKYVPRFSASLGWWKSKPKHSPEQLELLAEDIMNWAQREDAIRVEDFFDLNCMTRWQMQDFRKQSEALNHAYKLALSIIAGRREKGALTNKMNANVFKMLHPLYDKQYRKLMKWEASLKQMSDDAQRPTVVVIDKVSESPMVPKKKVKQHGGNTPQ